MVTVLYIEPNACVLYTIGISASDELPVSGNWKRYNHVLIKWTLW